MLPTSFLNNIWNGNTVKSVTIILLRFDDTSFTISFHIVYKYIRTFYGIQTEAHWHKQRKLSISTETCIIYVRLAKKAQTVSWFGMLLD